MRARTTDHLIASRSFPEKIVDRVARGFPFKSEGLSAKMAGLENSADHTPVWL
jgi:hypothetical protein